MIPRSRLFVGAAALTAGLVYTLALAWTSPDVGYVRDEGAYFSAARDHARWLRHALHKPSAAFSRATVLHAFANNREHPSVMKFAAAASALVLAKPPHRSGSPDSAKARELDGGVLPLLDEGQAMRLPAQLLAGFTVSVLAVLGFAASGWAGAVVAALGFACLPHVFFHAHLHAFDVPIASATLGVALVYREFLRRPDLKHMLVLGLTLGVSIGIKHNALFIPPLLLIHAGVRVLRLRRDPAARSLALAAAVRCGVGMVLVAPLVAVALWPWFWYDTLDHVREYVNFHGQHAYYNTEYFGANFNRPPFPVAYPFVLTLATVPTVWLGLALLGLGCGLSSDRQVAAPSCPRFDGALLALLAGFPLALIALPSVPIFGGTKHWITAYPFLAWAAAHGLRPWVRHLPRLALPLAILVVFPGLWAIVRAPNLGLSQYSALLGGADGAADLGLLRGFWGHAGVPTLLAQPELLHLPARAKVYTHDLHPLAIEQYRRDGRWPDWIPSRLADADAAFYFPERHMRTDEAQIWNHTGSVTPVLTHTIDDVPLLHVYVRQGTATKP